MSDPSPALTDRLAVVLVGARNPLNIGAVARAMSNFGIHDLRLINDYRNPLEEARSAINAAAVLHAAREFATVAEAIADCTLVYGTTAVGDRALEQPVDVLRDAREHVAAATGRTAILFGSEKFGLSNESIAHCNRLLTIPMHTPGTSMNLGQAVAVTLYEMVRTELTPRRISTDKEPATAEQLQVLDRVLLEAVEESEYPQRFPGRGTEQQLREYVRRLQMPGTDVAVWIGFLRQFLWKMRGNHRD